MESPKGKKVLILFMFCFFIYPPMLKAPSIFSYSFIYGIPLLTLMLNHHLMSEITKKQFIMITLAFMLVVFSIAFPTIHGTNDYSYIKTATYIFRKLIIILFLNIVLIKQYKEDCSAELFMYYYSWTHAVYVIVTMMFVFVPAIKNFWFSIFNEVIDSESFLDNFGYTFRTGWQGFSGYRFTLRCTISCIFLLYLYFIGGTKGKLNTKNLIFPYMLCFIGNMFYGRSGLVITILTSIIALLIWGKTNYKRILKYVGIALTVFLVIYQLRNIPILSDWYYWMSTPIKNLITTGSFNNYSFSRTNEMVFMPKFNTILMGDGYYTYAGHYYMRTDSGIMRNILFWGISGAVISYSMTIYLILETRKNNWLLCILLMICFVAFEYKGEVYYEFAALFLGLSFIESIKKQYLRNQPITYSPIRQ